jgi:HAD superfamily hydrolase (TIGR01490 family)
MPIAFFDLDRTLLAKNSGTLWVRYELRHGFISWTQALWALSWIVRYQLGVARIEDTLLESIRAYRGMVEADVHARTRRFYAEEVRQWYRPGARAALEEHRKKGEKVVLLTSSSNYLSGEVSADLGLDDYLCTRLQVDGAGLYTGEPLGPLCYGPGKVIHARELAQKAGVPLEQCAFYTDSTSDLPMLEAVGRPVVINPDPRLRRIAARRGWPVHDWGSP